MGRTTKTVGRTGKVLSGPLHPSPDLDPGMDIMMAGTGDGGESFKSRKLAGFVILVFSVLATIALATFMKTPEAIADTGLYIIGAGGLFTIGGQALVDALTRSKWSAPSENSSTTTTATTSTVTK